YRVPALPIAKTATLDRLRNVGVLRDTMDAWHCVANDRSDDQGAPIAFPARKIEAAGRALEKHPRLRNVSQPEREETVEFALGNIFFSLLHELGHALVTEMGLPVLGREEDAADSFASVTMLQMGTICSERMLIHSAMGWFLSDQRDRRQGVKLSFYG